MKPKKLGKNVADMDVLKDIRGLLSVSPEVKPSEASGQEDDTDRQTEAALHREEIRVYKERLQKQQQELERLEKENEELVRDLEQLSSEKKDISIHSNTNTDGLARDIAQLELRREELECALADVTEQLQLKHSELLKRVARIFQEAGQGDVAIEFRKGASSLESAENMARFMEILLGE